jgi:hypothetical protein
MKKSYLAATVLFSLIVFACFSQHVIVPDLHQLVKTNGIAVYNRELTLITDNDHPGIRLSKDQGEGVAWLKGIEFSNGILEFDVRGENVKQHSFVGIAFHGTNDSTFDAIYFRPFQFREKDEVLQSRAVQYISLPVHTWRKLREEFPGKYEHAISPVPDPDGWFHVRLVIKDAAIATYINGNKEPSLVVEKVTSVKSGIVGFYVADTSGGDFANISITKTD